MPRGGDMSPGGRHGHKIRELKRRIDAVLEEERAAREPPPPPISSEHAALRERIERGLAALEGQIPDGKDLDEAVVEDPDLAAPAVECLVLMQEEEELLAGLGVDPRPYDRYEPKF
jgi:hypothetical protein